MLPLLTLIFTNHQRRCSLSLQRRELSEKKWASMRHGAELSRVNMKHKTLKVWQTFPSFKTRHITQFSNPLCGEIHFFKLKAKLLCVYHQLSLRNKSVFVVKFHNRCTEHMSSLRTLLSLKADL